VLGEKASDTVEKEHQRSKVTRMGIAERDLIEVILTIGRERRLRHGSGREMLWMPKSCRGYW